MDPNLEQELVRFKRARDAVVHADGADLDHHLRDFVREVDRNTLLAPIISGLPPFDVSAWWEGIAGGGRRGHRGTVAFDLPPGDGERLVALLDLARSMASGDAEQVSVFTFGYAFGKSKMSDAAALAISLVLRPLAELLGDRIRRQVEVANPAIRELAGVPLDRIPGDEDSKVFLSHKTTDKAIVMPFYEMLLELGLSPWLDEKDMRAGDALHREIAMGFDQSCAVVFFVTAAFKDEHWLKHEVDEAVRRRVERGDRFRIITLVFDGAEVPRPLRSYLYIAVDDPLRAARQVVRALPLAVGPPRWRA